MAENGPTRNAAGRKSSATGSRFRNVLSQITKQLAFLLRGEIQRQVIHSDRKTSFQ
jgi:hypothetical protein